MQSEQKHTPGPWKVHPKYPDEVWFDPLGEDRQVISLHVRGRTEAEGEANARLIASAPDLASRCAELEKAMRWALSALDNTTALDDIEDDPIAVQDLAAARRALASKEGGA